jgi:hypothetical protein
MPLRRRALFQPTDSRTGASQVYDVASDALDLFTQEGLRRYESLVVEEAETKGREAGVQAGLEGLSPDFEEGNTVAVSRYNAALATGYAASMKVDVSKAVEAAAEAAAKAGDDVEVYDSALKAYADGNLQQLDPRVAPMFRLELERMGGQIRDQVVTAHRTEALETARAQIEQGLETTYREGVVAAESSDLDGVLASQDQYLAMLDLYQSSYGLSTEQYNTLRGDFSQALVEAAVIGDFRQSYDAGAGADFVLSFARSEHPAAEKMTEEERSGLIDRMYGHMADQNRAADLQVEQEIAATEAARIQSEQEATDLLISGGLTADWIQEKNRSGDIDPALARTLLNSVREGNVGASDRARLNSLLLDPFQSSEAQILSDTSLTLEDQRRVLEERRTQLADRRSWRSTQGARVGVSLLRQALGLIETPDGGFVSPFGGGDAQEQIRQYGAALRAFHDETEAEIQRLGGFEAVEPYQIDQIALRIAEEVESEYAVEYTTERRIRKLQTSIEDARAQLSSGIGAGGAPLRDATRAILEEGLRQDEQELAEKEAELQRQREARRGR